MRLYDAMLPTHLGSSARSQGGSACLIKACDDTDRVVAGSAESALGFIGRDAAEAVPTLIGGLKNQDSLVRMCATYGLGGIGPGASQAVPALIAALSDHDPPCVRALRGHWGRSGQRQQRPFLPCASDSTTRRTLATQLMRPLRR